MASHRLAIETEMDIDAASETWFPLAQRHDRGYRWCCSRRVTRPFGIAQGMHYWPTRTNQGNTTAACSSWLSRRLEGSLHSHEPATTYVRPIC